MFPEQEFALHIYRLFLPVCTSTFLPFGWRSIFLPCILFFVLWKNYFAFWIAVNIFALYFIFCIVEKLFCLLHLQNTLQKNL
jgi:hypothetical protein